jgi:hypothetical protein
MEQRNRTFPIVRGIVAVVAGSLLFAACGSGMKNMKPIAEKSSGEYIVTLLGEDGVMKNGRNDLVLEFRRASDNQLVEVANPQASATMSGMNMSSETEVAPADAAGRYSLKVDLSMAGTWDIVVTFDDGQSVRFSASAL